MDKSVLLKSRLPEEEVEVPGVGTVRVRGLSRADVLAMQKADTSEPGAFERMMLARAMVDPELTEEEAGQWQEAATPSELDIVTNEIARLSALAKDAAKDAYKEFEARPDAEFRVLPGEGAGDDGGDAEGEPV